IQTSARGRPGGSRLSSGRAVALFDLDGTLVDTNYQHALGWFRALRRHEITVPIWRIHRHIGMGGDQIVTALAGADVERKRGDRLRSSQHHELLWMPHE